MKQEGVTNNGTKARIEMEGQRGTPKVGSTATLLIMLW